MNDLFSQQHGDKLSSSLDLYSALPEDHKYDYESIFNLADKLEMNGHHKKALELCELPMPDYGHVGFQLYIICGRAYYNLTQLDKAEVYFQKALEIAPNISLIYHYLSLIHIKRNDLKKYIEAKKQYLRYTRINDALETLWDIALAEQILNNTDSYNMIKTAIIEIGTKIAFLSEKDSEILQLASNQQ